MSGWQNHMVASGLSEALLSKNSSQGYPKSLGLHNPSPAWGPVESQNDLQVREPPVSETRRLTVFTSQLSLKINQRQQWRMDQKCVFGRDKSL